MKIVLAINNADSEIISYIRSNQNQVSLKLDCQFTSISSFSVAALMSFSVFIIDKCQRLQRLSFNLFALTFTHTSTVYSSSLLVHFVLEVPKKLNIHILVHMHLTLSSSKHNRITCTRIQKITSPWDTAISYHTDLVYVTVHFVLQGFLS